MIKLIHNVLTLKSTSQNDLKFFNLNKYSKNVKILKLNDHFHFLVM